MQMTKAQLINKANIESDNACQCTHMINFQ